MSAAASWTKPVKTRLWQISLTVPVEAEEAAAALLEKIFGKVPVIYTDAETPMAAVSVYCPKLPRPEGDLGAWLRAGLKQIQVFQPGQVFQFRHQEVVQAPIAERHVLERWKSSQQR